MEHDKIIAVVGATGAQGGSLVRAILNDPEGGFKARAITRDAASDKAIHLQSLGAEVVEANVDDKESLIKAFKGAYGVYCVTFFWEHFSPETEMKHAKNMAEAAKTAGVKHVIWSTLEDTRKWVPLDDDRMPTLMEKYKVPHFDGKGEANDYFIKSGIPYTLLHTSFYWDNFINFGMGPQPGKDNEWSITLPMGDKKLPGIAAEDIGKCAYQFFKGGEKYTNASIGIAGDHLTGDEIAATFTKVLQKKVNCNKVSPEMFRSFDFPGADDLGNMFQFKADFEDYFCGARNLEFSRKLNPEMLSFEDWLIKNRESFEKSTAASVQE
ncbi:NmrA/HSCARG family protein [Zunongwangia sp. H14]|uniref:NmrA/HSCARG family protein n=1 Tax=Zunongwangia sp. H14 TaxID=3240792 RepID=UPI003569DF79